MTNNYTKIKLILILILALLLAACSTQTPPPATPRPTNTFPPQPTVTHTIQPTSIPTALPTSTPTPIPTPLPKTLQTDLPFSNPDPEFYRRHEISPNGEWIAWIGWAPPGQGEDDYPNLLVENISGEKSWLVEFNQYLHTVICPATCFFEPVLWTTDGRFLFLKTYSPYDGTFYSPSQAVALLKLSLRNGELNTILPPRQKNYYYAISPDAQKLVYSSHNSDLLSFTLFNINTHQKRTFSIDYDSDGYWNIFWSPYNHAFIFGVHTSSEQDPVFVVNLEDISFVQIYAGDLYIIESVEWLAPTEIKFTLPTESVIINTQTGETTPAD